MKSYKISTNWRAFFVSVCILMLSFSVIAGDSSFNEDGICVAPTKFTSTSFDGKTNVLSLSWATVPGAIGYRVTTKVDGGAPVVFTSNGKSPSKSIQLPKGAKSVIVDVQSECAAGQLSDTRTIILRIIATQGDISDIIALCDLIDFLLGLGYTHFYVEHPFTGIIYYYTDFMKFFCPNIDGLNPRLAQLEDEVSHFPNPFSDQFTIRYNLQEESVVSLAIYDVSGKIVQQSFLEETQGPGIYDYPVETGDINSGVYFYRLEVNGQFTINRIIKMK